MQFGKINSIHYKIHNQSTFRIQSPNEVENYQSSSYICSSKSVLRILSFKMYDRALTSHLVIHLKNGQRAYYTENNIYDVFINPRDTTVTSYFKITMCSGWFTKSLTYDKVSSYYTWKQTVKTFQRRKQGTPAKLISWS